MELDTFQKQIIERMEIIETMTYTYKLGEEVAQVNTDQGILLNFPGSGKTFAMAAFIKKNLGVKRPYTFRVQDCLMTMEVNEPEVIHETTIVCHEVYAINNWMKALDNFKLKYKIVVRRECMDDFEDYDVVLMLPKHLKYLPFGHTRRIVIDNADEIKISKKDFPRGIFTWYISSCGYVKYTKNFSFEQIKAITAGNVLRHVTEFDYSKVFMKRYDVARRPIKNFCWYKKRDINELVARAEYVKALKLVSCLIMNKRQVIDMYGPGRIERVIEDNDCNICFDFTESCVIMVCCKNTVCFGCFFDMFKYSDKNYIVCPYCRFNCPDLVRITEEFVPNFTTVDECIKRIKGDKTLVLTKDDKLICSLPGYETPTKNNFSYIYSHWMSGGNIKGIVLSKDFFSGVDFSGITDIIVADTGFPPYILQSFILRVINFQVDKKLNVHVFSEVQ